MALEVLAAGSTLLAVFVRDLFGLQGPRWAEWLVVWLGLSLAGVFVALVLVQWTSGRLLHRTRTKYQRRARFAEAAGSLSEAHQHISDAIHQLRHDEGYAVSFHTALTALARSYSIVAGADCRATVKRLGYDGEEPEIRDFYVRTFGRDQKTGSTKHDRQMDRVTDNTDFEVLFEDPDRAWWFANDLTTVSPYKNSHWDESTVDSESYDYVATIVWPIRRTWREPDGQARQDLRGYLAVDTLAKDVFARSTDFGMGAGVAEHLYDLMVAVAESEAAP